MNVAYDNALWPSLDYFSGTSIKIISPVLPRIDYIFRTSALEVIASRIVRQSTGDHYPVLEIFHIEGGNHVRENT